jgi:hypothetical protein
MSSGHHGSVCEYLQNRILCRGRRCQIFWSYDIEQEFRFVEISSSLIKESRIPLYSSKFSKKTYNQHQLLILILIKEYLSEDYRDTVDLLDLMSCYLMCTHYGKVIPYLRSFGQIGRIFSLNQVFYRTDLLVFYIFRLKRLSSVA